MGAPAGACGSAGKDSPPPLAAAGADNAEDGGGEGRDGSAAISARPMVDRDSMQQVQPSRDARARKLDFFFMPVLLDVPPGFQAWADHSAVLFPGLLRKSAGRPFRIRRPG
ncbi:hypothetical protein BSL82_11695 [Tardibacter chloracetimidivorans]|uniref:Uncharacterized protein n=1 Tax=Tardibacter chloracetimidivorans TaxID=1921510 RepID=A0A1L3ZW79_9SPHN|nr:hypothetical protein BSL82_11695 [Tardibacter chloracetimidivorans]